jgi:hypothetical protein
VRAGRGEQFVEATTDDKGEFALPGLPAGEAELTVAAAGWGRYMQNVRLSAGGAAPIVVELRRPLPEGQIRGQVRGFAGERPAASIIIEPPGLHLRADERGQFRVDVAPGDYRVTVEAPGYYPQTRPVHVEHNGVTVLVVDLYRKH